MKTNYQKILDEIIDNLEERPTLLLHACCGVCSSYVLEYLTRHFDITILYYNPNIYPEAEYIKRLNTQKEIIEKMVPTVKLMEIGYDDKTFNKTVVGLENEPEGGARCNKCFYLRLEQTAKIAKEQNFDYFCTTLSVSPYKNSSKLNEIGKLLEQIYNVKYLYSDFKKKEGYKRSTELAKYYNLYRQDYCGCQYSLEETLNKN